jgi:uncharacterized protein
MTAITRFSPPAAALVLGVIWALWHIPTFLGFAEKDSAIPYCGFAIMTVATSVITAWLYLGSGGSVLVCAVWHAVADASYAYAGVVGRDHAVFWAAVVLEVTVAGWLAVRGGRQLSRSARPVSLATPAQR